MEYLCDYQRHLICVPYTISNLHGMAKKLGLKRCWYHHGHYDIPQRRMGEIMAKCTVVSSHRIVIIIREAALVALLGK